MTTKIGTLLAALGLACMAATWTGCGDDDDGEACTGSDCDVGKRDAAATRADSGPDSQPGAMDPDPAKPSSDSGSPPPASTPSDAGGNPASDAGGEPAPGDDAATSTDAGNMEEPDPPSEDGDQLSVCTRRNDCAKDLGCYAVGPGRGFCTARCDTDRDCEALAGAEYTCSSEGLCKIDCRRAGPSDEMCPDGLLCTMLVEPGMPMGDPGMPPAERLGCQYPPAADPGANPESDGRTFSACSVADACNDGLQCTAAGYCSPTCDRPADCKRPRSGSIVPTCEEQRCVLSCGDKPEGCPNGMTCVDAHCTYR